MIETWKCNLVKDFINDNKEIAFLYMLREDESDCQEMIEFIEEMQLTLKFSLYCNIRAEQN